MTITDHRKKRLGHVLFVGLYGLSIFLIWNGVGLYLAYKATFGSYESIHTKYGSYDSINPVVRFLFLNSAIIYSFNFLLISALVSLCGIWMLKEPILLRLAASFYLAAFVFLVYVYPMAVTYAYWDGSKWVPGSGYVYGYGLYEIALGLLMIVIMASIQLKIKRGHSKVHERK